MRLKEGGIADSSVIGVGQREDSRARRGWEEPDGHG